MVRTLIGVAVLCLTATAVPANETPKVYCTQAAMLNLNGSGMTIDELIEFANKLPIKEIDQ